MLFTVNVQPPRDAAITPLGGAVLLNTPVLSVVPTPEYGSGEPTTGNLDDHLHSRFAPGRVGLWLCF
jgi:hypothetical protein